MKDYFYSLFGEVNINCIDLESLRSFLGQVLDYFQRKNRKNRIQILKEECEKYI